MYYCKKLWCLIMLVYISTSAYSQFIKIPDYSIETGAIASAGKQTPFWLMSNQYGLISPKKYNALIRLGLKTNLSATKNIDYDYGLDVVDRQSNRTNKLYLHQAYLRLKLYFVNFQVGSIEEKFGNQDSSLSSGGLLWSGNARPMPKVSILVPEYTAVPFTRGILNSKVEYHMAGLVITSSLKTAGCITNIFIYSLEAGFLFISVMVFTILPNGEGNRPIRRLGKCPEALAIF